MMKRLLLLLVAGLGLQFNCDLHSMKRERSDDRDEERNYSREARNSIKWGEEDYQPSNKKRKLNEDVSDGDSRIILDDFHDTVLMDINSTQNVTVTQDDDPQTMSPEVLAQIDNSPETQALLGDRAQVIWENVNPIVEDSRRDERRRQSPPQTNHNSESNSLNDIPASTPQLPSMNNRITQDSHANDTRPGHQPVSQHSDAELADLVLRAELRAKLAAEVKNGDLGARAHFDKRGYPRRGHDGLFESMLKTFAQQKAQRGNQASENLWLIDRSAMTATNQSTGLVLNLPKPQEEILPPPPPSFISPQMESHGNPDLELTVERGALGGNNDNWAFRGPNINEEESVEHYRKAKAKERQKKSRKQHRNINKQLRKKSTKKSRQRQKKGKRGRKKRSENNQTVPPPPPPNTGSSAKKLLEKYPYGLMGRHLGGRARSQGRSSTIKGGVADGAKGAGISLVKSLVEGDSKGETIAKGLAAGAAAAGTGIAIPVLTPYAVVAAEVIIASPVLLPGLMIAAAGAGIFAIGSFIYMVSQDVKERNAEYKARNRQTQSKTDSADEDEDDDESDEEVSQQAEDEQDEEGNDEVSEQQDDENDLDYNQEEAEEEKKIRKTGYKGSCKNKRQLKKEIKKHKKLIKDHEKKLEDYKKDPYSQDDGRLRNSPKEAQKGFIERRIKILERQIKGQNTRLRAAQKALDAL